MSRITGNVFSVLRRAISVLAMVAGTVWGAAAQVTVFPVPKAIYYKYHNDDFTVQVRPVGEKEWVDLYEYKVKVDMDTNSDATFVMFDM